MSLRLSVVLERIRRSEYTGDNRCHPCTVLNLLIAVVGAGAVGRVSVVAGGICLAASLLLVYLRGYLVPGTPRLTALYFPAWILRVFDKQSPHVDAANATSTPERLNTAENDIGIDPEAVLESAGVIEPGAGQEGPSLSTSFDARWHSRIKELSGEPERQRQALERSATENEVSIAFIDTEEGVIADADGTWIGTWPSRVALAADIAAEPLLRDAIEEWSEFDSGTRGTVLQGLRSFLDSCPSCSGTMSSNNESRSVSCCRSVEYGSYRCDGCGATLVEQDVSGLPDDE